MKRAFIAILLLIVVQSALSLPDQIIINSRDWRDVYSGMNYASLAGVEANFLIEESRASMMLNTLDKAKQNVLLIESDSVPYVSNYRSSLAGYQTSLLRENDLNLEIAKNAEIEFGRFIVLDDRFSYNAISVASYATLEGYYILFARADNIDDILAYLRERDPEIIVYGYVDREVRDALGEFSPRTINLGSKYENNLEMARSFMEKKTPTQFVLTSGAFLEPQFFLPESPVVFIGNTNTPEQILDFLEKTEIKHAVLVGNDLVDLAVSLKQQTGMKIMVKFAKGINQVQYTLDILDLPKPDFYPRLSEVNYNTVTKELIATIENTGLTPMMMRGTYSIQSGNTTIATAGDEDAFYISNAATKTYKVDFGGPGQDLQVKANFLYGEDAKSLDYLTLETGDLNTIAITDNSLLEIKDAYYDQSVNRFVIVLANTGDETVFATAYVDEFMLNDRLQKISAEGVTEISPGKTAEVKIKAKLTAQDIEDNPSIHLKIQYGSQKRFLMRTLEADKELVLKSNDKIYIGAGIALLAIAIVFLVSIRLKRVSKKMPPPPRPKHKH